MTSGIGPRKWTASLFTLFVGLLSLLCFCFSAQADTFTWTKNGDGLFEDPTNWDKGAVPGPNDDAVIPIPNITVTVGVANLTVKSVQAQSAFSVFSSPFKVTGPSFVNGHFFLSWSNVLVVDGAQAEFRANGSTSVGFGRFHAINGGKIYLQHEVSFPQQNNYAADEFLLADGPGSLIDLSGVQEIKGGYYDPATNSSYVQRFEARNGGQIDLSGLKTIYSGDIDVLICLADLTMCRGTGPMEFSEQSGGVIILDSLERVVSPAVTDEYDPYTILYVPEISLKLASDHIFGSWTYKLNTSIGLTGVISVELPVLQNAIHSNGWDLILPSGAQYSQNGPSDVRSVNLGTGSNLTLPAVTTMNLSGSFVVDGGIFNAPVLTSLSSSSFTINGPSVVSLPNLFSLNGGITVQNGAQVSLPAVQQFSVASYFQYVPHEAIGVGSKLSFPGITTLSSASWSRPTFLADFGGVIEFPNLQEIASGQLGFEFRELNGGSIQFGGLTKVTGGFSSASFYLDLVNDNFSLLSDISSADFDIPTGKTLTLPSVTTVNSARIAKFNLAQGSTLSLPLVNSLDGVRIVATNATFTAPNLTSVVNSLLDLSATTVSTSPINSLTYTALLVKGGTVLSNISATTYTASNSYGSQGILVDGAGSLLDLHTVNSFDPDGATITVSNGGTLNLSGLSAINSTRNSTLEVNSATLIVPNVTSLSKLSLNLNGTNSLYSTVTQFNDVAFEFAPGDNLTINAPISFFPNATIKLNSGAVIALPSIQSLSSVNVTVLDGATLTVPQVDKVTQSTVSIFGTGKLDSAVLTDIAGSRFAVGAGAAFDKIGVNTIDLNLWAQGQIFSAADPGSLLDLSTINVINSSVGSKTGNFVISASRGGTIDLSGLTVLDTGTNPQLTVSLNESNGSDIIFDGIQAILGAAVKVLTLGNVHTFAQLSQISAVSLIADGSHADVVVPLVNSLPAPAVGTGQISLRARNGGFLRLPNLQDAIRIVLGADGATIDAPKLVTLLDSSVILAGAVLFNSGILSDIDRTTFDISRGATFDRISDTIYDMSGANSGIGNFVSVYNPGSFLDLSSVQQIFFPTSRVRGIFASNGGRIDLSGLEVAQIGAFGPSQSIVGNTGGVVELTAFRQVNGGGVLTLTPNTGVTLLNLSSFSKLSFTYGPGVTVLPNVTSLNGGTTVLNSGAEVQFPGITAIDGAYLDIKDGGKFVAPTLTQLTKSFLSLDGTAEFLTAPLSQIDSSQFKATNGATISNVVDTVYDRTNPPTFYASSDLYVDNGSIIDLSSVQTIILGSVQYSSDLFIDAYSLGTVKLTNLSSISVPSRTNRQLFVNADGGTVLAPSLVVLETTNNQLTAKQGGKIDLSSLPFLSSVSFGVNADGAGSVVDMSRLCAYPDSATLGVVNGGLFNAPRAMTDTNFVNASMTAVRTSPQVGACSGAGCSTSVLFTSSFDGVCVRDVGISKSGATQVDLDGLSQSVAYGLLGYQINHSATTGAVTSSQLVTVSPLTGAVSARGAALSNREIRGAMIVSSDLYAVDVQQNALIKVNPANGAVVGSAIPVTLGGTGFDVTASADIALNKVGKGTLTQGNAFYEIDLATGAMSLLGSDTASLSDGLLPGYSGIGFGIDPADSLTKLYMLSTAGSDQVVKVPGPTAFIPRDVVMPSPPATGPPDMPLGDISSISTLDTTAPGAVNITLDGRRDGTSALVTWSTYDEFQNGNDIDHYTVYFSNTAFTDATQGTVVGTVPGGVKQFLITNLTLGQILYVAVTATDRTGNVNTAVTSKSVTVQDGFAPGQVTNLTVHSQKQSVVLNWGVPNGGIGDAVQLKIYQNNSILAAGLSPTLTTYTVNGLSPATLYQFRISLVDGAGNENSGVAINGVTYLAHPTGLQVQTASGSALVSWSGATPNQYVGSYRIYLQNAPFSSVSGLTPHGAVGSGTVNYNINNLSPSSNYYMAVTTVNITGAEDPVVTAVPFSLFQDTAGPNISNIRLGNVLVSNGMVIKGSVQISADVVDPSTIASVQAVVSDGTNSRTINLQGSSFSSTYLGAWNLNQVPDTTFTLTLQARDSVGNISQQSFSIVLDVDPPPAPVIVSPANGYATVSNTVSIVVNAAFDSKIRLYNSGVLVGGPTVVGSAPISFSVPLLSGSNLFTATAEGVGGVSSPSSGVTVRIDTSVPQAPIGVRATSQAAGEIVVSWVSGDPNIEGRYDIYRANGSFNNLNAAQKLNTTPITGFNFKDLPASDGRYFYRVVGVSDAGLSGPPSLEVNAVSDRIAPTVDITYSATNGPINGVFGRGVVNVELKVSEPLVSEPFLSLTVPGGVPIPVSLSQVNPLTFDGGVFISGNNLPGTYFAVVSARDNAGNRGTVVNSGSVLTLDTVGPKIKQITTTPASPILNSSANPVNVAVALELDEAPKPQGVPTLQFALSGPTRQPVDITNLSSVDGTHWQGSFALPGDAGTPAPENLTFIFGAEDLLGNIGSELSVPLQVYQGTLPPAAIPGGLTAKALAAGKVELKWFAVNGASGYQLFRKDPNQTTASPIGGVINSLQYTDQPGVDGVYEYSISSIRDANGSQALSAPSLPIAVTTDSLAPNAPQNLVLTLEGRGVKAVWVEPAGGIGVNGLMTYRLYRANVTPGAAIDVTGLTPVVKGITELEAVDATPIDTEHGYVVTAVDEAGNESPGSNTEYLNFTLLPVQTVKVVKDKLSNPSVQWTSASTAVAQFKLTASDNVGVKTIFNGNGNSVLDSSYVGGERTYTITALDQYGVESVARSIMLPALSLNALEPLELERGVFNRQSFEIENLGLAALNKVKVQLTIHGKQYLSPEVSLGAGEKRTVEVIVGGVASLFSNEAVVRSVVYTPNVGESVELTETVNYTIRDGSLTFTLDTDKMIRGGQGQVRLNLFNPTSVESSIVLANGSGPSSEMRFKLLDSDGNVLWVQPVQQSLGSGVVVVGALSLARVKPGESFTSQWFDIGIPLASPSTATLMLEVDKFHYGVGSSVADEVTGHGTSLTVQLTQPPYLGEILNITPQQSFGDQDIVIDGRAVDPVTNQPVSNQPLDLVLKVNGFERKFSLVTDLNGDFSYSHKINSGEGGVYTVSAVYPGGVDRPNQGQFIINSVNVTPAAFTVNAPVNYETDLSVVVGAGAGTALQNVRLEYLAQDQSGQGLIPGLFFTLPQPISLAAGESGKMNLKVAGDRSAPNVTSARLRVVSDSTGNKVLGVVNVALNFSSAAPSVSFTPTLLQTGITQSTTANEQITVKNNGLAPLLNAKVSLVEEQSGAPAPRWIYLTTPGTISRLEVGESIDLDLMVVGDSTVGLGMYQFLLRVEAVGETPVELPIVVAVVGSGVGDVIVKVSDIYTGTLDQSGNVIPGLAGAKVKIANEDVTTIETNGVTDSLGEVQFTGLATGNYLLRVSKDKHDDQLVRFKVKPGITVAQDVFLLNNLVSIEWSVDEITIDDRYIIRLEAVYETEVPAPVLVFEPTSVQLPSMKKGDIYNGELALTNYGLIEARNTVDGLPKSFGPLRFEYFGEIPETLEPKERIVIPYRITAVGDLDQNTAVAATGGGACDFISGGCIRGSAICSNGVSVGVSACTYWFHSRSCVGVPGIFIPGVIHGSGGSPWTPRSVDLPDTDCIPGSFCSVATGAPSAGGGANANPEESTN